VKAALDFDLYEGTRLVVRGDIGRVAELARTAVSIDIELREGATVRGSGSSMLLDRTGLADRGVRFELPAGLANTAPWSLHVRGGTTDVLHAWNAERRWDGELVIPLGEVRRH